MKIRFRGGKLRICRLQPRHFGSNGLSQFRQTCPRQAGHHQEPPSQAAIGLGDFFQGEIGRKKVMGLFLKGRNSKWR